MSDKLTPEQAARLLRAKASELEIAFRQRVEGATDPYDATYLLADLSLLYDLVADFMERVDGGDRLDIDDANVRDMRLEREQP